MREKNASCIDWHHTGTGTGSVRTFLQHFNVILGTQWGPAPGTHMSQAQLVIVNMVTTYVGDGSQI